MTLKETINKLLNKDTFEIYTWINFLAHKTSCKDCVETKLKQSKVKPRCELCVPSSSLIKKYFSDKGDSNDQSKQK